MAIAKRDMLQSLINSLNSAEKRYFTTHYSHPEREGDDKFYQLFVHLSNGGDPTDAAFRRRIGVEGAGKMANLQRHLYGQLIESLRRQHRHHDEVIRVQETLDYAHLLYERGLHLQALILLGKAKVRAKASHLDLHHILILEMEKMIQGRHITRSEGTRMQDLMAESRRRQEIQSVTTRLSNLQLRLQRYFIDHGHVWNDTQAAHFHRLYAGQLRGLKPGRATFRERINYERARFWCHYCALELDEAAAAAAAWVRHFDDDPDTRLTDLYLYLKGLDRCLTLAFFRHQPLAHAHWQSVLETFVANLSSTQIPANVEQFYRILHLRTRLNQALLTKGREDIGVITHGVENLRGIDRHKQHLLRYKMAFLLARDGAWDRCLDYLEPILDDRKPLRHDLIIYARLLFICAHLELGNPDLAGYSINNLSRYLSRYDYPARYPREVIRLLRQLHRRENRSSALRDFRETTGDQHFTRYELRDARYFAVDCLMG